MKKRSSQHIASVCVRQSVKPSLRVRERVDRIAYGMDGTYR